MNDTREMDSTRRISRLATEILLVLCISFSCTNWKQPMTQQKDAQKDDTQVITEIVFFAPQQVDPTQEIITSENIGRLKPDPQAVKVVCDFFTSQDFSCTYYNGISATLEGTMDHYEATFDTRLQKQGTGFVNEATQGIELPLEALPPAIRERIVTVTLEKPVDFP